MVGVESLVDSYHTGHKHYDGVPVVCRLPAGSFRVRPDRIDARLCGPDEMVRFEPAKPIPPIPEDADIQVFGTCSGTVRDGTVRCADMLRIDWYVRVVGCEITVVSP